MNHPHRFLISLIDIAMEIKNQFELLKYKHWSTARDKINYNHIPYLQALLTELFQNTHVTVDGNVGSSALDMLIRDGLSFEAAQALNIQAINFIIATIVSHDPNVLLAELQFYQWDFCGEFDILLSKPNYSVDPRERKVV